MREYLKSSRFFADKDTGETMRNLIITFGLLIASATATLHSLPSLAAETYQVYQNKVRKSDILRFREGDTVVYHKADGSVKTFRLGKDLGQGENGRVFDLAGSSPSEVIKFSKNDYYLDKEFHSFQKLEKQNIPHAKVREYEPELYIIKDRIYGATLVGLNEEIAKLPHVERTKTLKKLNEELQVFDKALRNATNGFDDLHAANVMFDGNELRVIDVMGSHNAPDFSANAFRSDVKELSNIGPGLSLLKEDPIWLERFYNLRDFSEQAFLSSERLEAAELRNALRTEMSGGHKVPPIIQEQIIAAAAKESSSPQFRDKIQPMLQSILERGEVEGHSVHAMTKLLLEHIQSPAELIDLANLYSKKLSHKVRPTYTFFEEFAKRASWNELMAVFHQIPSEFKPLLMNSATYAAKTSDELIEAFNLPLSTKDVEDPEFHRLALMQNRFSRIEKIAQSTKLLLDFRNHISPGTSPKTQRLYTDLYFEITLLSNTILEPAISLYKKHGFETVHLGPHPDYERCNIEMRLML